MPSEHLSEAAQGMGPRWWARARSGGLLTVRAAELLGQPGWWSPEAAQEPAARRHMSQDAVLADPADAAGIPLARWWQAAKGGQLAVRLFPGDPLLNGAVADRRGRAPRRVRFEIVPRAAGRDRGPGLRGYPRWPASGTASCASSTPPRRARSRQPGPRWSCSARNTARPTWARC